jgi:hypothetical protein
MIASIHETAEGLHAAGLVRATSSLPPYLYETLEEPAQQKKVSLAWVVRVASVASNAKDGRGGHL